jgi:hypothetical protein
MGFLLRTIDRLLCTAIATSIRVVKCGRAGWMMGRRADSTMGINRMTLARAVFAMPIVESARQGSAA